MSLADFLKDISYWGPAGGFVAGFLDSTVLPLVQVVDLLVVFRGAAGDPEAWLFAAAACLGSVAGSIVLLNLSRQGRRAPGLRKISKGRAAKYLQRMERYPVLALMLAAVIPVPFPVKAFVVTAGLLDVSAWRVGLAMAVARGVRYFGLTWLGQVYGEPLTYLLREYRWPMVGVLALTLSVIAAWRFFGGRGKPSLGLAGDRQA